MEILRNRKHFKPRKFDEAETLYILQIKSTFTGFKSYGCFDCLAFRLQTKTFKNINLSGYCVLEFFFIFIYT